MQKIYTENDLIRYIYKETNPAEDLAILTQVNRSEIAAEELENLQSVVGHLKELDLEPHPTSVNLILEYSLKLHEPAH